MKPGILSVRNGQRHPQATLSLSWLNLGLETSLSDEASTDYAVELGPLVALWSSQVILRLAGAELAEVLCRLGHDILEELEGDSAQGFTWKKKNKLDCRCLLLYPRKIGGAINGLLVGRLKRGSQSSGQLRGCEAEL